MSVSQKRMLWRIIGAALLLLGSVLVPLEGWPRLALFLLPYLLIGWDVLKEAGGNILRGQVFDENFLMSIATIGAFAIGDYPEAVVVMLLYQVGELFQSYAVGKSRKSIADLMDIRPDYANLEKDGQIVRVEPDAVNPGDIVVVKPGERIPLDGTVVEGRSSINTAALTGESLPRDVREGLEVLSGCVNQDGVLRIRVDKAFGESTVQRILEMVENASDKKAETENFITRFARVYTPAVVGAAVLLAVVPPLFVGGWGEWLERALTFLVISCPCALVISVPMSFFGGIGGASRAGILVKGGNYLEALAKVDTLVCDKTGTLTEGSFSVTAVHPQQISEPQLLEYAAMAEAFSGHPIAVSLRAAHGKPIDQLRIKDVSELSGLGVQAEIDGKQILLGNGKLMDTRGIEWHECHLHGTEVHLAVDGEYAGHVLISDRTKPGAKEAVEAMRGEGVRRIVMLTGDTEQVARSVAGELGIDEVRANLLPEDKVDALEAILSDGARQGKVAFVGDGINDAPVLTRADLGIAMGALGSDAAIEAADVVLMDDKLMSIPRAMRIAKKTVRIANQNIVFALSVKGVVLLMGALGLANMWVAVFADVGVSILAILNAMRAMKA